MGIIRLKVAVFTVSLRAVHPTNGSIAYHSSNSTRPSRIQPTKQPITTKLHSTIFSLWHDLGEIGLGQLEPSRPIAGITTSCENNLPSRARFLFWEAADTGGTQETETISHDDAGKTHTKGAARSGDHAYHHRRDYASPRDHEANLCLLRQAIERATDTERDCSRSHTCPPCSGPFAILRRRRRTVSKTTSGSKRGVESLWSWQSRARPPPGGSKLISSLWAVSEIPLWDHADVNFHQLAILISAASGLAACTLSFFLMWMHALHYTKPAEQRKCVETPFP